MGLSYCKLLYVTWEAFQKKYKDSRLEKEERNLIHMNAVLPVLGWSADL